MNLTVKLFATLKDKAQANQLVLELEQQLPTVQDLLSQIVVQNPSLASSMKSILVAVNHEFAFSEQILGPNDDIAIFPPVSGG
ncbi:MAG: molybdopterin converting factor subunit 1 [Anaerolineaceae bacterium]|jgi:molybdopterin converting factor subunit 1|nr:MAG: molybdopterin converting factor subunit 1 [Anaerolineaceae bacterium]